MLRLYRINRRRSLYAAERKDDGGWWTVTSSARSPKAQKSRLKAWVCLRRYAKSKIVWVVLNRTTPPSRANRAGRARAVLRSRPRP